MINQKNVIRFVYIILIILQITICVLIFRHKGHFDVDEIYTYGLANCEEYPFLTKDAANAYGKNGWMDSDFFLHYVTVDRSQGFSFYVPYKNQTLDVHPPLYYFLIHLICYFFGTNFTIWSGLLLNFFVLLILDFFIYKISMYLLDQNRIASVLCIFLWTFSAAGLSNIIFIRMYLLLTLMLFAFVYVHVIITRNSIFFTIKELAAVFATIILGGLTHYYFYPFVFFFSFPICIYLLVHKKWMPFLKYVISLLGGFCVNILFFPATMNHVFNKNRGIEVIGNIGYGLRKENVFLKYYLGWINDSFFGGLLFPFLALVILFLAFRIIKNRKDLLSLLRKQERSKWLFTMLLCFAMVGYAYIAIKGSYFERNRYIYPLYAFGSILVIRLILFMANSVTKNKYFAHLFVGCVSLLFVVFSLYGAGINTLRPLSVDIKHKAEALSGYDCLIYESVNWFEVNSSVPFCMNNDETFLLDQSEIDSLEEILDKRETKNDLVVWIPSSLSRERADAIVDLIIVRSGCKEYAYAYSDLMHVYELK